MQLGRGASLSVEPQPHSQSKEIPEVQIREYDIRWQILRLHSKVDVRWRPEKKKTFEGAALACGFRAYRVIAMFSSLTLTGNPRFHRILPQHSRIIYF